jgi:hypothetical protein
MSTSLDDLETILTAALTAPQRAKVDTVDITQPTLYEQIALAKHLASINATRDPRKAFTLVKIVPPGAV